MDQNFAGVKVGSIVTALGHSYKIARILYSECWERDGYDIEFLDPYGGYHHWKQWDDGGYLQEA